MPLAVTEEDTDGAVIEKATTVRCQFESGEERKGGDLPAAHRRLEHTQSDESLSRTKAKGSRDITNRGISIELHREDCTPKFRGRSWRTCSGSEQALF